MICAPRRSSIVVLLSDLSHSLTLAPHFFPPWSFYLLGFLCSFGLLFSRTANVIITKHKSKKKENKNMLRSTWCVGVWLPIPGRGSFLCANRNCLQTDSNSSQQQRPLIFFCYAAETAYHIKSAMKLTSTSLFFSSFFLYPSPSLLPEPLTCLSLPPPVESWKKMVNFTIDQIRALVSQPSHSFLPSFSIFRCVVVPCLGFSFVLFWKFFLLLAGAF